MDSFRLRGGFLPRQINALLEDKLKVLAQTEFPDQKYFLLTLCTELENNWHGLVAKELEALHEFNAGRSGSVLRRSQSEEAGRTRVLHLKVDSQRDVLELLVVDERR